MKKQIAFISLFLLMLNLTACKSPEQKNEDIHARIHSMYYAIESYSAKCSVTSFTKGGENTYDCQVDYTSDDNSYKIVSDDMTISLTSDKTVISRGDNVIETSASEEDMYIFVNTFFKSYYESEDTVMNVSKGESENITLLECSVINPSVIASSMKLWIDNDSALPVKMQVFDKSDTMNTQIDFESFEFR